MRQEVIIVWAIIAILFAGSLGYDKGRHCPFDPAGAVSLSIMAALWPISIPVAIIFAPFADAAPHSCTLNRD